MTSPVQYRAVLIGCGRIASEFAGGAGTLGIYTHAQAYQACRRTRMVAVCDVDAGRAEACARRWDVPRWYTDARRMMAEEAPDLVSICTPDETHETLALDVMAAPHAPRGLLCEKPLASTVEGARRVAERARRAGVRLAVNYTRRYAPNLRAVRDVLRSDELGCVQAVHGWYTKGVLHNGTHWFDLLRYLLGEVRRVSGLPAREDASADPGINVTLDLDGGATARLASCDERAFTVFEMDILMTRGRLELRDAALSPRLWVARPSTRFAGYTELMEEHRSFGTAQDTLLHAVQDLVDALETGREPLCSARDGIVALTIATTALASARRGGETVAVEQDEG